MLRKGFNGKLTGGGGVRCRCRLILLLVCAALLLFASTAGAEGISSDVSDALGASLTSFVNAFSNKYTDGEDEKATKAVSYLNAYVTVGSVGDITSVKINGVEGDQGAKANSTSIGNNVRITAKTWLITEGQLYIYAPYLCSVADSNGNVTIAVNGGDPVTVKVLDPGNELSIDAIGCKEGALISRDGNKITTTASSYDTWVGVRFNGVKDDDNNIVIRRSPNETLGIVTKDTFDKVYHYALYPKYRKDATVLKSEKLDQKYRLMVYGKGSIDINFVTYYEPKTAQAKIGEVKYATLSGAVADVKDGETIQLIDSITLDAALKLDRENDYTLDLNGKTITTPAEMDTPIAVSKGNVTLIDSASGGQITFANSKNGIEVASGATLNIVSGTYKALDGGGYAKHRVIVNHGTLNITGGAIEQVNTATENAAIANYGTLTMNKGNLNVSSGIFMREGSNNTISGGEITASNIGVSNNGTDKATASFSMTKGTIRSTDTGIYLPTAVTGGASITGGTVHGNKIGLAVRAGKVTVSGDAKITANAGRNPTGTLEIGKTDSLTGAIVIGKPASQYTGAIDLQIEGGTVTNSDGDALVVDLRSRSGETSYTVKAAAIPKVGKIFEITDEKTFTEMIAYDADNKLLSDLSSLAVENSGKVVTLFRDHTLLESLTIAVDNSLTVAEGVKLTGTVDVKGTLVLKTNATLTGNVDAGVKVVVSGTPKRVKSKVAVNVTATNGDVIYTGTLKDALKSIMGVTTAVTITPVEPNAKITVEAGEDLTIPSNATLEIGAGQTLEVAQNGTLTNEGKLTNTGTVEVKTSATLTNKGTVTNEANAKLENSGTLTNETGAKLENSGTVTVASGATLTNNGTVEVKDDGKVTGEGTLPTDSIKYVVTIVGNVKKDNATGQDIDSLSLKKDETATQVLYAADPYFNGWVLPTSGVLTIENGTVYDRAITIKMGANPAACTLTATTYTPAPPPAVEALTVTPATVSLKVGETAQLTASKEGVTWASGDEKIATVSASGLVSAVGEGTVAVTASLAGESASCQVTVAKADVPTPPEGEPIPYEEIKVLAVKKGGKLTLPEIPGTTVTWRVEDEKVAKLIGKKLNQVKGLELGETRLYFTTAGGSKAVKADTTYYIDLKVRKSSELVKSIKVTPKSAQLTPGESQALDVTLGGKGALDKEVFFRSSNAKVATVDEKGVVKAVGSGSAKITAYASNLKKAAFTVTVREMEIVDAEGKRLSGTVKVEKGAALQLGAKVYLEGAEQKVTWKSAKPKYVSVSEEGLVTALKAGKAKITATLSGNKKVKATITIQVPKGGKDVEAIMEVEEIKE